MHRKEMGFGNSNGEEREREKIKKVLRWSCVFPRMRRISVHGAHATWGVIRGWGHFVAEWCCWMEK